MKFDNIPKMDPIEWSLYYLMDDLLFLRRYNSHRIATKMPSTALEQIFDGLKWHAGVSKNRGTPKWMVYNGKPH